MIRNLEIKIKTLVQSKALLGKSVQRLVYETILTMRTQDKLMISPSMEGIQKDIKVFFDFEISKENNQDCDEIILMNCNNTELISMNLINFKSSIIKNFPGKLFGYKVHKIAQDAYFCYQGTERLAHFINTANKTYECVKSGPKGVTNKEIESSLLINNICYLFSSSNTCETFDLFKRTK